MSEFRYMYCRAWNWKLWEPGGEIPEPEARSRFASADQDDWFSVVAYSSDDQEQDVPLFVLEVVPGGKAVIANFYLSSRSQSRSYAFMRTGDRMFMEQVTQWFYPDREQHYRLNKSILIEQFFFQPDGIVRRRVNDKSSPDIQEMSYRDVDVSANWEDVPEFGDWARFGREDR